MRYLISFAVWPCLLHAQASPRIRGPILGYTVDNSRHEIRPIQGLTGAAWTAEPLALPPTSALWTAPGQGYALALAAGNGQIMNADLEASTLSAIDGLPPNPSLVAFSPSGRAIALYYGATNTVASATSLPENPAAGSAYAVDARPTTLAISDDGQMLLLGGEDGLITARSPAGETKFGIPGRAAAMQFYPQSREAVLADTLSGQIRILTEQGAVLAVGDMPQGFTAMWPLARRRIAVASRDGTVAVFASDGTLEFSSVCTCVPSRLEPLRQTGVYLLTDFREMAPLFLLDVRTDTTGFSFVPATGVRR